MPGFPDLLSTGPKKADWTIALAHGAGAGMDTPFMNFFAERLADHGIRVVRFEFPYSPSKKGEGKAPLVFDFHGHGGTAKNAAKAHHIHTEWPEAFVVHMQGLNTPGKLTDPGAANRWRNLVFTRNPFLVRR
jgi:hypothetical protein